MVIRIKKEDVSPAVQTLNVCSENGDKGLFLLGNREGEEMEPTFGSNKFFAVFAQGLLLSVTFCTNRLLEKQRM